MSSPRKTVFFITRTDAVGTTQIAIEKNRLRALLVAAALVLGLIALLVIDYSSLLMQSFEAQNLKIENARLREEFKAVEGKVEALEDGLLRVQNFTNKLRLITNINDSDRSLNLSRGPQPGTDPQALVETERAPLDQVVDELHAGNQLQNQPLKDGELAIGPGAQRMTLTIRIERAIKETQLKEQSVLDLWEQLSERQNLLASTPNIRPARGWMSSGFGYRISPFTGKTTLHAGLDIAAAPGTPIYAPADGVVSFAGYDESYGKLISIDHGFGVTTRYGHCSQIFVRVGQRVSRYDIIGSVGNTGRSTGPHLHYEVRVNGIPRDPMIYILDDY